MALTRRRNRFDSIGSLGDMEYLASSGLWVPVSGTKATGNVPTIQADGTLAWATPSGGTAAETLITETVVGVGGVASVAFTSIATTWRDLRIVVRGRGANASTNINVQLQCNGDTGANYDTQVIGAAGGTLFGAPSVAQTSAAIGWLPAATAPAGVAGTMEVRIGNYRNTTFQKDGTGTSNLKQANATGNLFAGTWSFWWRNTAAISSLLVFASVGNLAQDTVVSLYGIL